MSSGTFPFNPQAASGREIGAVVALGNGQFFRLTRPALGEWAWGVEIDAFEYSLTYVRALGAQLFN